MESIKRFLPNTFSPNLIGRRQTDANWRAFYVTGPPCERQNGDYLGFRETRKSDSQMERLILAWILDVKGRSHGGCLRTTRKTVLEDTVVHSAGVSMAVAGMTWSNQCPCSQDTA